MVFDSVFDQFVEDSPVSVMFRGTMENIFSADRLNALFEDTAQRQSSRRLLFSMCADLMSLVVAKIRPSVNAAYKRCREQLGVSVNAVYDKLSGIEPQVARRMVQATAEDLTKVTRSMKAHAASPLSGYELRIVDGNHLAGTQHRLKELRTLGAAALPGQALAILNPQTMLIEDVLPCEDGHANERVLLPELLPLVEPGQCWLADRNFCTIKFLYGIHRRKSHFIIRQHGKLEGRLVGRRRKLGRIETGIVYQQEIEIADRERTLSLRRITVMLDEPTRDGDTEIHLLSNLPAKINGQKIAELYSDRWTLETAFGHLATVLRSEVNTLGYPDAALFGFCIGLMLYNILSTIRAALQVAHKLDGQTRKVSMYYVGDEIAGVYRGMMIAVPEDHWTAHFADATPSQLARQLLQLARKVQIEHYLTNPYGPKRPPPKRKSGQRGNHVSTQRILDKRIAIAQK